jgi:hypothetical protein
MHPADEFCNRGASTGPTTGDDERRLMKAMRFAGAIWSRLFLVRTVLGLLIVLYLLAMIASHSVPLSTALEIPLAVAGWLALAGVVALSALGRRGRRGPVVLDFQAMGWSWIAHLAFAGAAVAAFYFAFTGNISLACPLYSHAPCVKTENFSMSGGHYYRQNPYDSQGNDDPGAPWVEISRPEYVADVGARLRSSAQFGIGTLSVAWLLSGAVGAMRRDSYRSSGLYRPNLQGP